MGFEVVSNRFDRFEQGSGEEVFEESPVGAADGNGRSLKQSEVQSEEQSKELSEELSEEQSGEGDRASLAPDRRMQLVRLQQEVARRQARWRDESREARCPSGWKSVDQLLQGGFPRGQVSVVSGPAGSGRTSLAAGVVAKLTGKGELCAWIDPEGTLNPGALHSFGVALERLLWVRARENDSLLRPHLSGPVSSSGKHRERIRSDRSGSDRSRSDRSRSDRSRSDHSASSRHRSESSWAAHLLARSGAFAMVVVELCGERLSMGAGARLAEAARSGNTAVVVLASERDSDVPQAALKIRLESAVDSGLRLIHEAGPVERARPAVGLRHRRRVDLVVERTRRGAPGSAPVSFPPPFRQPPPWSTHQPGHFSSRRKTSARSQLLEKHALTNLPTVGGGLEVLPFTDKLHSGRPARHRKLEGDGVDAPPLSTSTASRHPATRASTPIPPTPQTPVSSTSISSTPASSSDSTPTPTSSLGTEA